MTAEEPSAQPYAGALEALHRILNREPEADEALRQAVAPLHDRIPGYDWVGLSFVEDEELRAGRRRLARRVRRYRPRAVAVVGVGAYRTAFDRPRAEIGRQEETLDGAMLWVLPNTSGLNAHYQGEDFRRAFAALRRAVVSEVKSEK